MKNINNILIVHISEISNIDDYSLFDYYKIYDDGLFGLVVNTKNIRFKLDLLSCEYELYTIFKFIESGVSCTIKENFIDYIGFNHDEDEILNLITGSNDDDRVYYLKIIYYYKTTQLGKPINDFKVNIKHFDDFINKHDEDVIEYEIITNNYDFSESLVRIKTYLTESEVNKYFKGFIID